MKSFVHRLGSFYKNLRVCMAAAGKDCDTWYHIPKSRFRDNGGEEETVENAPPRQRIPPRNYFLGSFRDCVYMAWKASDDDYYIPKSRFQDPGYNDIAYRSPSEPGYFRRMGTFLWTLKHCISMSWEASDTFHHLPKSRFQEADFIRELMKLTPDPPAKLLYRPYTIGRGIILEEATGKGWQVEPPDLVRKAVFVVPENAPGQDREPEVTK